MSDTSQYLDLGGGHFVVVPPGMTPEQAEADFRSSGVLPSAPTPVFSGTILPFTKYSDKSVGFDSNAGIVGMAKRALQGAWSGVTLPGDVATGKVDPESQEGIERALQLATIASPMSPASGEGISALLGARAANVPAPTAEALHAASEAGYSAARDLGVEYASPAVAAMAAKVQGVLNDKGMLAELAPQTHAILNKLQAVPEGASSVPFGNLDAARKAFGHAAGTFTNPTEQKAAIAAKYAIDDFVTNPSEGAVVAGPADVAAKVVADARANAAAGFRSDTINGIDRTVGLRSAATDSAARSGNAIRSRVATMLLNDKASAGFSPEELDALQAVTEGTATSNTARKVGGLLSGGLHGPLAALGGAAAGGEAGGTLGAIAGSAIPLVGVAARELDNALTARRLTAADELVRQRSPLYNWRVQSAPTESFPTSPQTALLRGAMLAEQGKPTNSSSPLVAPATAPAFQF